MVCEALLSSCSELWIPNQTAVSSLAIQYKANAARSVTGSARTAIPHPLAASTGDRLPNAVGKDPGEGVDGELQPGAVLQGQHQASGAS